MKEATQHELFARAFEEWLRRFNREPERFAKEYGEPEQYGAGCAVYFQRLLDELRES